MPPSGTRWLYASGAFSTLGIAVASYLTIVHYRAELLVCGVTKGCTTVQSSSYAVVVGIPVALLGLLMYIALLGLVLVRLRWADLDEIATNAAFAIAMMGVVYAGYLTYVELFVINAICQWCVVSAMLTLGLWLIEGSAVRRSLMAEPESGDGPSGSTIRGITT